MALPCLRAELRTVAELVMAHPNLYVMADEIYKDILYTGEHFSIASIPGMEERTIILDGFSKSYAMTGWRLGYGIMPPELVPHVVRLAVNSVSCAATFTQKAGIAALEGPRDQVEAMTAEFAARRRLITDGLRSIPGHPLPGAGRARSTPSPASRTPGCPAASLRTGRCRKQELPCSQARPSVNSATDTCACPTPTPRRTSAGPSSGWTPSFAASSS